MIEAKKFYELYAVKHLNYNRIAQELGEAPQRVRRFALKCGILPRIRHPAEKRPGGNLKRVYSPGDYILVDCPVLARGGNMICTFEKRRARVVKVYPRFYLCEVEAARGPIRVCQPVSDAVRAQGGHEKRPIE